MIEALVKIANDLDSIGLFREANVIDLIAKKASEQSLDRTDKLEQKAAKEVGKRLVEQLDIPMATPLYSPLLNIGKYPSFSEWAKAQPKSIAQGTALAPLISAVKGLGPSIHGSLAVSFGIPALASWNFERIGRPSSKLKTKAQMKGAALSLSDFDRNHIAELLSIDSNEPKLTKMTGTPAPLAAYILIRADGDIAELRELRDQGVVDNGVFNLVNKIGGVLREKRIRLKIESEKIFNAIRDLNIFDDMPNLIA